jgi:hypothetical protein
VRRVIAALEARVAHRQGDNWACPAHADRTPSLTVREGEHGALVACPAGCTTADVAAALGLSLADLFDEPRHNGNGLRRSRRTATSMSGSR